MRRQQNSTVGLIVAHTIVLAVAYSPVYLSPYASSRPRRPGNLLFHEMFFPAAHFLTFGEVSVIAVIARLAVITRRFVYLLSYPSLSRLDG